MRPFRFFRPAYFGSRPGATTPLRDTNRDFLPTREWQEPCQGAGMIRREAERLIIPLDERGRVVLTEEEGARLARTLYAALGTRWIATSGDMRTALDSLVPEEESDERE